MIYLLSDVIVMSNNISKNISLGRCLGMIRLKRESSLNRTFLSNFKLSQLTGGVNMLTKEAKKVGGGDRLGGLFLTGIALLILIPTLSFPDPQ